MQPLGSVMSFPPISTRGIQRRTMHQGEVRARQFLAIKLAAQERLLVDSWRSLEAAGLQPILIKGWSSARLYRDPSRRLLGDIDVCFTPADLQVALDLRKTSPGTLWNADLHEGVPDLPDRSWDEVFARTRLVALDGVQIRILALEDHLRLVCRHLLRSGAQHEKMILDVAATLEAIGPAFDWDEALRGDWRITRWVLALVGLAHVLYQAPIADEHIRQLARCPQWLVEFGPQIWSTRHAKVGGMHYLRNPRDLPRGTLTRWLNPVRASFQLGVLPRNWLHLGWTLARYACLRRIPSLFTRPIKRLIWGKAPVELQVHTELTN